jgi:hypothetical protein
MRRFFLILAFLTVSLSLHAFVPTTVSAQSSQDAVCAGIKNVTNATNVQEDCKDESNGRRLIRAAVSLLSYASGFIAVIMILISGYKYITSTGDANNVSSAKRTLLYAIVGIAITVLAQVMVRFVITVAPETPRDYCLRQPNAVVEACPD